MNTMSRLYLSMLGFGVMMGVIFPLYAQFFVIWKPGLQLWFDIGCVVAGSLIGVINIWIVNKTLLKTMGQGIVMADTLAKGDLTVGLTGEVSNCRIGRFLKSIDAMRLQWVKMIWKLSRTAGGLDQASKSLTEVSQEISDAMSSLSEQTSQMDQIVSEAANSITQMLGSITEVGGMTDKAMSCAQDAEKEASEVEDTLKGLALAMQNISKSSQQVGQVVSTITEIASRTNLLSLNAAIEAAKAGEAGRGFAVVAGEVRSLADQSGQAVANTNELIEQSREKVEEGSLLIGKMEDTFQETRSAIDIITAQVQGVTQAMDEQNQLTSQVQSETEQLAQISAVSQGKVHEFAEMTDRVGGRAEQVRNLALELRSEIDTFRLPEVEPN